MSAAVRAWTAANRRLAERMPAADASHAPAYKSPSECAGQLRKEVSLGDGSQQISSGDSEQQAADGGEESGG